MAERDDLSPNPEYARPGPDLDLIEHGARFIRHREAEHHCRPPIPTWWRRWREDLRKGDEWLCPVCTTHWTLVTTTALGAGGGVRWHWLPPRPARPVQTRPH